MPRVGTVNLGYWNEDGSHVEVSPDSPLPVTGGGSSAPGGTQDVDIVQVGGSDLSLGQKTAESSVPVVLTAAQVAALTPPTPTAAPSTYPVTDNGGSLTVDVDGNALATATATPGASDRGLVVRNIPSGTQPVSGTVSVSGTVTTMSMPSATSAGLIPFRAAALSNTAVGVKSSAGRVYAYSLYNPNTVAAFFHMYNALPANVTPGTTIPTATFGIPPGAVLDGYWNSSHNWSTAVTISASLNVDGSGAPTTGLVISLGYV